LLAGARVGRRLGLPVVLDMRDAWKYSYHARWPTVAKQRRFEELEREAIEGARVVVAVNEAIAGEAAELGAAKTVVLPNGFDLGEMPAWSPARDRALSLVFMGRMSPGASDPSVLFRSLARAREIDPRMNECHLTVIGPDAPWAEDLASHLGVRNLVSFGGFRPYREALDIVAAADLGVIALAEDDASAGVYSGKLFDYVGIGIPILVFGPEISGAAEIARETGCGHVIAGGDVEAGARILLELAEAKRQGVTPCVTSPAVRARFDRREQVRMLSELLRETARR
jgi:glycosyltransferase involved in cell wall biosynthesis